MMKLLSLCVCVLCLCRSLHAVASDLCVEIYIIRAKTNKRDDHFTSLVQLGHPTNLVSDT